MVSGVLSRHSYFFPPSLYMNSCISIFDFACMNWSGVYSRRCVCVCLFYVAIMCAILSGVIADEEVEFKIPTTRTRNDSLFCCVLL